MGKLKFCANISWLFKEVPFFDRYQLAADAGFRGVEAGMPYEYSLEELIKVKEASGVEQILLNSGDAKNGGNAANGEDPRIFRDELDLAISYANGLKCKRIHLVAGNVGKNRPREQAFECYVENLKYAGDILQSNGITGLIEPLNTQTAPDYVLTLSKEALDVLKCVNKPNLLYQLDFFHLQKMEGNLTQIVRNNIEKVGHIQVSQVPERGDPYSAGEINFCYIFSLLEELGYDGWIGCEYKPSTSTTESLKWFEKYKC